MFSNLCFSHVVHAVSGARKGRQAWTWAGLELETLKWGHRWPAWEMDFGSRGLQKYVPGDEPQSWLGFEKLLLPQQDVEHAARITQEDMKPHYTGAKLIEAWWSHLPLRPSVWSNTAEIIWLKGDAWERWETALLGIALGAQNIASFDLPNDFFSVFSLHGPKDRKSFTKKKRVLEAKRFCCCFAVARGCCF